MPVSVQQRVIAIHPDTKELRTAKILTAALNINRQSTSAEQPLQFRAQFDRSDLGVPYIQDQNMIPINDQGANWDMYRDKYETLVKMDRQVAAANAQQNEKGRTAPAAELDNGQGQHSGGNQSDSPGLASGVTLAN